MSDTRYAKAMNTPTPTEKSDSRTPEPKAPPKSAQQKARAERDRRKACHGSWYACSDECR